MKTEHYIPDRNHIVLIDFEPTKGKEALVVDSTAFSRIIYPHPPYLAPLPSMGEGEPTDHAFLQQELLFHSTNAFIVAST